MAVRWAAAIVVLAATFAAGYGLATWRIGSAPPETSVQTTTMKELAALALPAVPLPSSFPQQPPAAGALLGSAPSDFARQGDLHFEGGRYQEAIPFYQKALEANPQDADTWNDLGLALHYTGRNEEALAALRKGASLAPRFQRVWLSLGFVASRAGLVQEAKSAWTTVISIDQASPLAEEARKFLKSLP
jgi:Flp pilus assembly protein TadD